MRSTRNAAVIFVAGLSVVLSGCAHKAAPAVNIPPQAEAPTQQGGSVTPQPLYTPPPEPAPAPAAQVAPAPVPVPQQPLPVAKPKKKKVKPSPATPLNPVPGAATPEGTPAVAEKPNPATPEESTHKPMDAPEVAAANAAEGESPIGQLTAGDANSSPEVRRSTVDLIAASDRRLKALPKTLSADDQHTVALVKKFQQQARQALSGQDLQAAKTLAVKAKLLLDELQK